MIREVGAGLQISPNGMAVIDALGLGPAAERAGQVAEAVELINTKADLLPALAVALIDGAGCRLSVRKWIDGLLLAVAPRIVVVDRLRRVLVVLGGHR